MDSNAMARCEVDSGRPVMSARREPVAVYVDLDNTLIKGSALFHVGRGLAAQHVIGRAALVQLAAQHAAYRLVGECPRLVQAAHQRGLSLAAGLPVAEVLTGVEQLYDRVLAPRLWPGTVRLLAAHREVGTPVWLATAAPVELATLIADRLGLSGALGTRAQQFQGAWTGRLDGPLLHGAAKAAAVTQHARQQGWDLGDCAAYSDSVNDLPLLTAIGQPVAVNPDRRLRRVAGHHQWPVYDFRACRLGAHGHRPQAALDPRDAGALPLAGH
ncbi:HAD family hydrolase [Leekyejoonella antrihumi]|uniref:HAD-IB family hydrolase n=1 Tax=Leekyejoonella antrihumi TaxID=1660198 RepID=A0A563E7U5_9MICO|nr:HAD-IB family hydrolase [Leekyejoonella antrihumi]TWP38606.1 HAD-IB family hydrolase [Leekyejoonella antrihumi]